MTDNEIIKGLECCFINENCDGCPYEEENSQHCLENVCKNALDLINRQKAEIERLQAMVEREREKYEITLDKLKETLEERADHTEAIKEFAERRRINLWEENEEKENNAINDRQH